jgi:hypothetical protein
MRLNGSSKPPSGCSAMRSARTTRDAPTGRLFFPVVTRILATFLVLVAVVTTAPAPATAQSDPYAADPLRLVPFADTVQQVYTHGTDTWEVWQCIIPDWPGRIDVAGVTANLNSLITPYYSWLSDGRYSPRFVAGGTVNSDDVIPQTVTTGEGFRVPGCESAVQQATSGTANGVLIVVAAGFDAGYGTAGAICPEDPYTGCVTTYPGNLRTAVVGAATVVTVPPYDQPQWVTVAHELGHALNWPHSYGGLTTMSDGTVDQYDNPMDMMSGQTVNGLPIGTIAYNRYSAGWIDPSQVEIHRSGVTTYTLSALGGPGTQMLVIPVEEGLFYTLDTRRLSEYDSALPKAGVEVYEIDQQRTACSMPDSWPSTWPCFATLIRIQQIPPEDSIEGTAHVLSIDDWLDLNGIRVTVTGADSTSFTVEVDDTRIGNRFIDDDGNPHEANIEAIAAVGITDGCNPPLDDRYCPLRSVTRAEMAAFLVRALGEEDNLPAYHQYFVDVPDGQWYTGYVERLYELGITTGYDDQTYRPDAPVSRAEMASFLTRAFDLPADTTDYFTDDDGSFFEPDINAIAAAGITNGCNAAQHLYCPDRNVLRDQMASFLARALGLGS